jgi:hypothetical protein
MSVERNKDIFRKLLFDGPQGYAAGPSDPFRTVSPGTWVNKLPLGGGAVELSATGAQRAQNSGEHRIDLGQVRPYMI